MKNRLLVSVVMPAYNASKYIEQAVESITHQTLQEIEIIIVNDASTDDTLTILSRLAKHDDRIRVITNEVNLNICQSLNRGIKLSKAEYIARMDADDYSYPDRISKQYQYLQQHKDVVICGGKIELCDENLKVIGLRDYNKDDTNIRRKLFRYSPFCHATTMYRRSAIQSIGGYNQSLVYAEDYDMYFRLGKYGQFSNLDDVLYKVRTSKESISMRRARRQEELTLYIRIKAVNEYGYSMTLLDKIYLLFQFVSMYVIPNKLKFWIFHFIRQYVK